MAEIEIGILSRQASAWLAAMAIRLSSPPKWPPGRSGAMWHRVDVYASGRRWENGLSLCFVINGS